MKSVTKIKQSEIQEKWYLIDAKGLRIGTLASKIAELLMGKTNPLFRRYHSPMTKVIVINARELDFTHKRGSTKFFKSYSGFPGGLKFTSLENTFEKFPERPLQIAVKGMLPKNKMGEAMFSNLRVYAGSDHPHTQSNIEVLEVKNFRI